MQDAKTRAALLVICLACLIGSGIALFAGRRAQPPPVVITPPPPAQTSAVPEAAPKREARLYVDVAGSVRRPSLYVLPAGSRIMQAIRAAGGPSADADLDAVNLAQKVTDGEKVFVPRRGTPLRPVSPPEAAASSIASDAPPSLVLPKTSGKGGHSNKMTAGSGEQIALNTATAEQLERLPGVGPSMAGRILAYRQQAGGFGKSEDLMQVVGLGPKKFAKIAAFVRPD